LTFTTSETDYSSYLPGSGLFMKSGL